MRIKLIICCLFFNLMAYAGPGGDGSVGNARDNEIFQKCCEHYISLLRDYGINNCSSNPNYISIGDFPIEFVNCMNAGGVNL